MIHDLKDMLKEVGSAIGLATVMLLVGIITILIVSNAVIWP